MIDIVGIGGCGSNIAEKVFEISGGRVVPLLIDTDIIALSNKKSERKVCLEGEQRGCGTGGDYTISRKLMEQNIHTVAQHIREDARLVIVVAGMGGGTGSGALLPFVRHLREKGRDVMVVGIKPFEWEGAERLKRARMVSYEVLSLASGLSLISNTKVNLLVKEGTGSFLEKINRYVATILFSIYRTVHGSATKRIDVSDLIAIMRRGGKYLYLGQTTLPASKTPSEIDLPDVCDMPVFSAVCLAFIFQAINPSAEHIASSIIDRTVAKFGTSVREVFWAISESSSSANGTPHQENGINVTVVAAGLNGKMNHFDARTYQVEDEKTGSNNGLNRPSDLFSSLKRIRNTLFPEHVDDPEKSSHVKHATPVLGSKESRGASPPRPNPFFEDHIDVD